MAETATSTVAEVRTGDAVRARCALWRVGATRRERAITILRLQPIIGQQRSDRTLLAPFDRIAPLPRRHTPTRVSRREAMRALADLVTRSPPFDVPASVATAEAQLLPFQLEPLLALRTGLTARVLIADHVGLGKTVQAALITRDLLASRPGASILVLTPPGLRDQWRAELRDRAGVESRAIDADALRSLSAELPAHASPWQSGPVVVASIDFVKQADVLHGLRALVWDLLVVDEAHQLTIGSERLAAGRQLAARSARLVLLTATPHSGDERRYRALCDLGRMSSVDVLAVFRRTRTDAGARHRRLTRRLEVRPSPAEQRLHDWLERYARRVWTDAPAAWRGPARLAMTVLFRRAASSPASLVRSLERRRALLTPGHDDVQTPLPFGADDSEPPRADEDAEPDRVLSAPGLDVARERTWLNLLIDAGQAATRDERKLRALLRLVGRTREPLIVFTEYRDTLQRVAAALARTTAVATLHGGKSGDDRAAALRAFDAGAARVLVATDAASEGLNLHRRCRAVVHVELPWSPTRLEQRIGRVDRLGQTRTVHTLYLVMRGTVEARIEASLAQRARRIQDALAQDGDAPDEYAVVVLGSALHDARHGAPGEDSGGATPAHDASARRDLAPFTIWPRLAEPAASAAAWLAAARRLAGAGSPARSTSSASRARQRATRRARGPIMARVGLARGWPWRTRGWLCVYRSRVSRPDGALVEQRLTAFHVHGGRSTTFGPQCLADGLSSARAEADPRAVADAHARRDRLEGDLTDTSALVSLRVGAMAARDRAATTLEQLPLFGDRGGHGRERDAGLIVRTGEPIDVAPAAEMAAVLPPRLTVDCHLVVALVLG